MKKILRKINVTVPFDLGDKENSEKFKTDFESAKHFADFINMVGMMYFSFTVSIFSYQSKEITGLGKITNCIIFFGFALYMAALTFKVILGYFLTRIPDGQWGRMRWFAVVNSMFSACLIYYSIFVSINALAKFAK